MLPTQPFRDEHRELVEHIEHLAEAARQMPTLTVDERQALRGRLLRFLNETLLPHAAAEERVLYPEWSRLVGFAGAAAPMIHDHEAIAARVKRLEGVDAGDVGALQELLFELHGLISVHFAKEEEIQLPALDDAPDVAERILGAMARDGHSHSH